MCPMATLPNVPTDSLYKFVALFGIVLLAFGLWYPKEKFRESSAQIRQTVKENGLTRIRISRKMAQVSSLVGELGTKYDALAEKQKPIDEAKAAFDAKSNAVSEELNRILKTERGDVKGATARANTLVSESNVLGAKLREMTDAYNRLSEEYKPVLGRQNELLDELSVEAVNLKGSIEAIEDLNQEAKSWFEHMLSCIVFGWTMIIVGFILWYVRVQRYEDAILRKRATAD